jgi:hypothetical protein
MNEEITPEHMFAFVEWISKWYYMQAGKEWYQDATNLKIADTTADLYAIFKKESEEVNKKE